MGISATPSSSSSSSKPDNRQLIKNEENEGNNENKSIPLLLTLPPELIDHLLGLVPPLERQITTLSLLKVFPEFKNEISQKHLWENLIIYNSKQFWPLWKRLQKDQKESSSSTSSLLESSSKTKNQINHHSSEEEEDGLVFYGPQKEGELGGIMCNGIKSLTLKSWKGDADILNNILRCIKKLNTLQLNIGTNFSPDHLEEMFESPRKDLKRLEMRFRPYVEQASYYQFLAGSYFDTAVETLTKSWPVIPTFTHLSIVQDLPPRSTVPPTAINSTSTSLAGSFADLSLATSASDKKESSSSGSEDNSGRSTPPTSISSASDNPLDIGTSKAYTGHGPFGNPFLNEKLGITKPKTFAQPIVFFDINCISKFGISPIAENLTHLRLRVPSRDLLKVLINPPRGSNKELFPSLKYLDISTTNVRIDTNLITLLRTYSKLEHLILDRVNLFGFTAREKGPELCFDLGSLIVSSSLSRGKEKERLIAAKELEQRTRLAELEAIRIRTQRITEEQERRETDENNLPPEILAEIQHRERIEEQQRQIELARSRRGHRSAAHSTFSLRDRTIRRTGNNGNTASSSTNNTQQLVFDVPPTDKMYLVLPPLPTLKSISIGGEASGVTSNQTLKEWEENFHKGWKESLNRTLGWAIHVSDKFERAKKKADDWRIQESKSNKNDPSSSSSNANNNTNNTKNPAAAKNGHISKSKRRASISNGSSGSGAGNKLYTKPPLDVRLFRFPSSLEEESIDDEINDSYELGGLLNGLIEIDASQLNHKDYLDIYKQAIGDSQLYLDSQHEIAEGSSAGGFEVKPPCIFCTVPDCEGPARRGAEGERVDGRGGMNGIHPKGCGHLLGRKIWGSEGF
ncbi:uncharacterized protein L201_002964 [Kwoniella dendrophila CBS 6074]|uniref:F-box domain-containing protein n=1 Tax=Kwoniella dendrophila CBS 6074 TaxID=1295534 RepID=A0AAX4JRN4_9TREE